MKNSTFNLKKFRKKAYYDDAQGLIKGQSRCWMNCYKSKIESGSTPQEAILSCKEEYQHSNDGKWDFKYASNKRTS